MNFKVEVTSKFKKQARIYLITIYDKSEQTNISDREIRDFIKDL